MEYSLLLANDRRKTYSFITLFILLLNAFVFGYMFLNHPDKRTHDLSSFGLLLSLIYILIFFIKQKTKYFARYKLEISFIVLGVLWLVVGNIVFALALFGCAVMGFYAAKDPIIIFNEKGITYPGLRDRKIGWEEVSNVILKDDVLTIDLKNNKLIQSRINSAISDINVEGFNNYCALKMS